MPTKARTIRQAKRQLQSAPPGQVGTLDWTEKKPVVLSQIPDGCGKCGHRFTRQRRMGHRMKFSCPQCGANLCFCDICAVRLYKLDGCVRSKLCSRCDNDPSEFWLAMYGYADKQMTPLAVAVAGSCALSKQASKNYRIQRDN